MGKKTKSKPANWIVYYHDHNERYKSQQAALIAIDRTLVRYENGIWDRDDYHILIRYKQEETVDDELFDRHHLADVLAPGILPQMLRIDIYAKNKQDWIFKYGSDLLQQALRAGYDCNEGYLAQRLARDYPGFTAREWGKYKKVDTPNEICLYACSGYEHSYCSIDNFLGKYQLIKLIDDPMKVAEENSLVPTAANTFATRMKRFDDSVNSSPITLALVAEMLNECMNLGTISPGRGN